MTLTTTRTPRGTVVRAGNYSPNPKLGTSASGWAGTAGTGGVITAVRSSGSSLPSTSFYWSVTWTTGTSTVGGGFSTPAANVTPGTTYVHSVYVICTKSQRLRAAVQFSDGSVANGPDTIVPASTWTRLSVTAVTPAGATTGAVSVGSVAGTGATNWANGDLLAGTAHACTNGPALLDYFDGSTGPTGDLTYAWVGTPELSTSLSYMSDPASLISPLLVLGWDEQQAAGNLFHVLLSGAVVGVQRLGAKRSGTLHLFFGTDRAAAMSARAQHQLAGTWAYQDTDLPETTLTYMVAGPVHLANDEERTHWTLDVPFQEV